MDSLTHIAIGACIGDLFLGRKIGKKAMLYGAFAASLPDIDFIATLWLNTVDDLLTHRGFTHSFLFAVFAVLLLAFILRKRHYVDHVSVRTWLVFMGTEIFVHLFLDAFNAYGIGWFEPFNHKRISFHVIFVADPFFSIGPGIAAVSLLLLNGKSSRRRAVARSGLVLCSFYFFYCLANKFKIEQDTRFAMVHQGIQHTKYFTTPSPFNNWLWYIVAETDSGFQTGYRSVFDRSERIEFHYHPRNAFLLRPFNSRQDLQKLERFSQGYYTADSSDHGIVFNDLRFGQIMGWQNPDAGFVFYYYLQEPDANKMVVQRGRFSNWNWESNKFFLRRIRGN
jgi:inner membrane protein